jgi:membrane protease YdiL (CAAX protease family)
LSAHTFWIRVVLLTALAVSLAVAISPPRPPARVPLLLALALGVAAGVALFGAAARGRRAMRARRRRRCMSVGRQLFLGLCAANEEVLWRRLLLGELLPLGSFIALGASSAAFALAHRRRRGLHIATGAAFGALYVLTGVLGASIAAHWVYNASVASIAERAPP